MLNKNSEYKKEIYKFGYGNIFNKIFSWMVLICVNSMGILLSFLSGLVLERWFVDNIKIENEILDYVVHIIPIIFSVFGI